MIEPHKQYKIYEKIISIINERKHLPSRDIALFLMSEFDIKEKDKK